MNNNTVYLSTFDVKYASLLLSKIKKKNIYDILEMQSLYDFKSSQEMT